MTDENAPKKPSASIHEAINKIMDEVGYVKKSKSPNLTYSFAGEAALISGLRPSMVDHGVYMHVLEIKELRRENYVSKNGAAMTNTTVSATVRFAHAPSGTYIDVAALGEGSDAGDKSANKAMTGLYKYALRQTFCIETGDDPDKSKPEEKASQKKEALKEVAAISPAKIVELKLADNPINAAKLIDMLAVAGWEEKAALNKISIYRAWRVKGKLEPTAAAEKTNNGEVYTEAK